VKKGYRNIISLPSSATRRIVCEITKENKYIRENKIDVVYSCFGHALIRRRVCQICGVADSNLLFPEIDFWEGYQGLSRVKKWLVDEYRKWGYRRAAGLVYENAAMEERSKRIFGKEKDSIFIKPSFSIGINNQECNIAVPSCKGYVNCLFLCGWQRNKGILIIPEMVKVATKKQLNMEFYISANWDKSDQVCAEFIKKAEQYNSLEHIHLLGRVDKSQIMDLYNKMDLVFLLSKLESFSNNIIEAWHYEKPLIIADEEWAHGICNDAALYVDRDSAENIIDSIVAAMGSGTLDQLVEKGKQEFMTYPTVEEKVDAEIEYVKKVWRMDKI